MDGFIIGSEFRGLTWVRGSGDTFPFVSELVRLAGDVRAILGSDTKLTYGADWTEYFGYQPPDGSGDVYYHLDPLWPRPRSMQWVSTTTCRLPTGATAIWGPPIRMACARRKTAQR